MAARKGNGRKQNTGNRGKRQTTSGAKRTNTAPESSVRDEIALIAVLAVAVFLFLCNFGVIGVAGDTISHFLFGVFGLPAYAVPVLLFLAVAFRLANKGLNIATLKLIAGGVLVCLAGIVLDMVGGASLKMEQYNIIDLYRYSSQDKCGGGVLFGTLAYLLNRFLDKTGTMLIVIVLAIICIVIITEKSLLRGVREGSQRVYESAVEDSNRRRERSEMRRQEQQRRREELELQKEQEEQERILRMDKKVSGVMLDTSLAKEKEERIHIHRDDIHEITLEEDANEQTEVERIRIHTAGRTEDVSDAIHPIGLAIQEQPVNEKEPFDMMPQLHVTPYEPEAAEPEQEQPEHTAASKRTQTEHAAAASNRMQSGQAVGKAEVMASVPVQEQKKRTERLKEYAFPPISLLQKGSNKGSGDSANQLKETAMRLQQTLQTFGVKVTITDISQGPAVTRYEMQPEAGVKVSRIVNLADDIKLNLAATDIRIEAPIPGKAAVGIEVPNKENATVALRDLLESKEFKSFPANLAFAVGKDIGGKTIVTDIAKMPHMLIAGATGSGKSVCINTLIMSILYKASPEDVKMIMVDPKVVELSVYNGIPHLLIPVVTDPKKAAAALHWGVAEMTDRYKKFADFNVRDLKGYNKKVESMAGSPDAPAKMPQIVIIVDELADLMMVAPGEVEESICRLAQLARAAGIHLIIATQRPSVDVITGLIKANMPSRVAFAVSSGVDSRTILDMNGAEKLLGKGDMLFYPQGYPKPARIQGAFVSDKEVADVVDFLKNQTLGNVYSDDIESQIQNLGTASGGGAGAAASEKDDYFVEAGRFIIEKDKASIGLLQRAFKIGFNRAARIMDQLYEAGVVGDEEGTKPRKILMSSEEFEQYIEESV
ncbi:MAG: DNA translocase FtsK [Lachnospiraceae bacterium]|nr:DNA translocase FtsK [Lachnospiraceae bacterium]